MIVLEVRVNGDLLATAGQNDLCVLNTIVDAVGVLGSESIGTKVEKEGFALSLNVGGLSARTDDGTGNHLRWISHGAIQVGDEICIRILEAETADPPAAEKTSCEIDDEEVERKRWESACDFYLKHKAKYAQDHRHACAWRIVIQAAAGS
jgi:hypothetical protein